jgi:putative transcriptional regulator
LSAIFASVTAAQTPQAPATPPPPAQSTPSQGAAAKPQSDQDQSSFLIARPQLADPFFKQSIVMMLPLVDKQLVIGLIVNKPLKITLAQVFPKVTELKDSTDPVYFGGPVEVATPAVLFRSTKSFKQAFRLTGDLYISFDGALIESILKKKRREVSQVRLFLGRSQWAAEQLGDEMESGSWYGEKEENNVIFSADQDLWRKLIVELDPGLLA